MFTAAGEAGTIYDVTVHVYGVVELRSDYAGGERRQGASTNANSNKDFWYAGGAYTPGAGYNVYGLRVTPAVEGVENVDADGNNYFLNARDSSGEGHEVCPRLGSPAQRRLAARMPAAERPVARRQ